MSTQNNKQSKQSGSLRFVVAVMSRDRVGIVRDVTAVLNRQNANIDSISQTVLSNYFALTFVVSFPEPMEDEAVRELLRSAGAAGEFEVGIKTFEPGVEDKPALTDADSFVLTVTGQDRPGILGQLAACLAGKGINILDLYVRRPDAEQFVLISQLAVPRRMNIAQIRLDIEELGRRIHLTVALQHENIFRATNELTPPSTFF